MDSKSSTSPKENEEMLDSSQTPALSSAYYGETNLDCIDSSHALSILEISERDCKAASPATRKMYQAYRGELQLCVEVRFGDLTVHVIRAKNLSAGSSGAPCDTFVRVSMVSSQTDSTTCYTDIIPDSSDPLYDEKFTYELIGKDYTRRVLISVFSRDRITATNTLIGCMSFGISNIAERRTVVDGWYYILAEKLGEKKHMCVRDHNQQRQQQQDHQQTSETSSPLPPAISTSSTARKSARFIRNKLRRSRRNSTGSVQSSSSNGSSSGQSTDSMASATTTCSPTPGCYFRKNTAAKTSGPHKPMKMMTVPVLSCHTNNHGYGFSLSEGFPCRISKVEGGSAAFRSGLREGDIVVRVNGQSVHRMYPETVGRIIKHYPRCVVLDILRHSHKVSREVAVSATCQFLKCLANDSDQDTSEDEVLGSYSNVNNNIKKKGMKGRKVSLGYVQLDGHPEMLDPSFSEPSDKPVFHQSRRDDEAPRPVNQVGPTLKEDIVKDLNENHLTSSF